MAPLTSYATTSPQTLFARNSSLAGLVNISTLSAKEMGAVEIIERTTSLISILSSLFVLISFTCSKTLRQSTINRLIFYASFGNLFSNVATLISVSGLKAGVGSSLCQAQGFMIQWFMPADALWTLCMSVTVFVIFNPKRMDIQVRSLEIVYLVACYGLPFIPALAYLIEHAAHRKTIYGDATIWCWVTEENRVLRLATFYGVVWFAMLATLTLYGFVAWNVFRNQASNTYVQKQLDTDSIRVFSNPEKPNLTRGVGSILRTREVNIRVEDRPNSPEQEPESAVAPRTPKPSISIQRPPAVLLHSSNLNAQQQQHNPAAAQGQTRPTSVRISASNGRRLRRAIYSASVTAPSNRPNSMNMDVPRINTSNMRGARKFAIIAVALFVVMLIVWVPSSTNRIYSFNHPPKFGLEIAAAAVLPLQGFFNNLIYCYTSRRQLRIIWRSQKWRLSYKNGVAGSLGGRRSFPAERGDAELPLRGRRSVAQHRRQELEDLDSRYDADDDEESRIGGTSFDAGSPVTSVPPPLPAVVRSGSTKAVTSLENAEQKGYGRQQRQKEEWLPRLSFTDTR